MYAAAKFIIGYSDWLVFVHLNCVCIVCFEHQTYDGEHDYFATIYTINTHIEQLIKTKLKPFAMSRFAYVQYMAWNSIRFDQFYRYKKWNLLNDFENEKGQGRNDNEWISTSSHYRTRLSFTRMERMNINIGLMRSTAN